MNSILGVAALLLLGPLARLLSEKLAKRGETVLGLAEKELKNVPGNFVDILIPSANAGELGDLRVKKGQITFNAEGNDIRGNPYFTRVLQFPPDKDSGVTLGRGYDMKERTRETIYADLIKAGFPSEKAAILSQGAGLVKVEAHKFVKENAAKIGEITYAQQKSLFEASYAVKEEYIAGDQRDAHGENKTIKNIGFYARANKENPEATPWLQLNPAIKDIAVDFSFQGTSKDDMRAIATNDFDKIIRYIEQSKRLMSYETGRNRITYLKNAKALAAQL